MRRLHVCFLSLRCGLAASPLAFGQASQPAADSAKPKVYTYTKRLPVFPAREAADSTRNTFQRLQKFLEQDKLYPAKALRDGVQGQVKFSFAVDAHGRITAIRLVQSLRADVDSAVLRDPRNGPRRYSALAPPGPWQRTATALQPCPSSAVSQAQ